MKRSLLRSSAFCLALVTALALSACEDASFPTATDEGDSPAVTMSKGGAQPFEGRYIVVLADEFAPGGHAANRAAAADVARGLGLSPIHSYGSALFGFAAVIPEGRLNGLLRNPRVARVEPDKPVSLPTPIKAQAPPWCSDPDNANHPACGDDGSGGGGDGSEILPWGIDRIDADLNTNTGAGIHVYVIDSGIDTDHADLQGNLSDSHFAVENCKGGSCLAAWDDDNGHGTHVAGTIGAIDNDIDVIGVAPGVTLHAVKVLNKRGSGSWSGVVAGIDWVTSEVESKGHGGKAVANMSLGGSGSKNGTCTGAGFSGSGAMHEAICNSARAGVIYVVAAGNEGDDAENHVPAAYDDAVITVSATSEADKFESWSNWGDGSAGWTSAESAPVAIGAPGGNILSTQAGGGTTTMSGTSMASPHAAGAAALYLKSSSQGTSYSAFSNTRNALLNAAETGTIGNEDPSNSHAEGFLDAEAL